MTQKKKPSPPTIPDAAERLTRLEAVFVVFEERLAALERRPVAAPAVSAPAGFPRPTTVAASVAPVASKNDPNSAFNPDGTDKTMEQKLKDAVHPDRFIYRGPTP